MAGAGFKTFNTGDVLTSSDVNTYLMQQTVMVFDDASARSTALPTPSEGMFSYLKDTNLTYRYDGSAWLSDAGATSPLTTKGDVWGYSTADARIPVGADGTVLTADSAETLGVKWAAVATGSTFSGCFISAAGDSIPNTTATVTRWNNEVYDTDAYHINTSPDWTKITIPSGKTGYFLIHSSIRFYAVTSSTTTSYIGLYKNGSLLRRRFPSAYSRENWTITCIESLTAGDYLEIYLYQDTGGTQSTVNDDSQVSTFMVSYLGA